jgi:hypothetical protein
LGVEFFEGLGFWAVFVCLVDAFVYGEKDCGGWLFWLLNVFLVVRQYYRIYACYYCSDMV